MTKRWLGATLWGAAALVAVGAGGAAVAASSNDGGRQVLSRAAVDRQLKALPAVSPGPVQLSPTATPTRLTALSGPGGSVGVACIDGAARLMAWWPASGYRADDPMRGPAATVSVRFESDTKNDVLAQAHCSATGTPILVTTIETDDHGHDGPTPVPSSGGPVQAPQPSPSVDDHGHDGAGPPPSPSPEDKGKGGHGKDDPSPHR